ncbi:UNVERIFIED_ORG: integrase [Pseudomonas parafulva]|nr:integrase [Pseudomonas parafulva]
MARISQWKIGEATRHLVLPELKYLEIDCENSDFESVDSLVYTPLRGCKGTQSFTTFNAIINADGSPWLDGSLYLFECVYQEGLHYKTIAKRAEDLAEFKRVIDQEGLNYLASPKNKFKRPTYFYLAHLNSLVDANVISEGYGDRKICAVHNLYKWLVKTERIIPEHPLWSTRIETRIEQDEKGFSYPVDVPISDLRIRRYGRATTFQETVSDGGQLRPMSPNEKKIYIEALTNVCPPELILASEISLDTGAREQTVFGLREKDIENLHTYTDERGDLRYVIDVGKGTGIDTKKNKRLKIFISAHVLHAVKQYVRCEHRLNRVRHAKPKAEGEQYIFLTKFGNPYYQSNADREIWKNRNPYEGASLRLIITSKLVPEMKRLGGDFSFSFHDLRATFALDTYRKLMNLVDKKKLASSRVKNILAALLGHSNTDTVDDYIRHGERRDILIEGQRNFEKSLRDKL